MYVYDLQCTVSSFELSSLIKVCKTDIYHKIWKINKKDVEGIWVQTYRRHVGSVIGFQFLYSISFTQYIVEKR